MQETEQWVRRRPGCKRRPARVHLALKAAELVEVRGARVLRHIQLACAAIVTKDTQTYPLFSFFELGHAL